MACGTGCPLAAVRRQPWSRAMSNGRLREGPVDPHRVARSKSDLWSMILRRAHGLGNKAVAAKIGVPE